MNSFINRTMSEPLNKTDYRIAEDIEIIKPNQLSYWRGKTESNGYKEAEGFSFKVLKRFRQVSGLSWSQFGKILDEEF